MLCVNGKVVWDDASPAQFKGEYSEFATVDDVRLGRYFREATLILANDMCPVRDCQERIALYNLLIAHKAFIAGRGAGVVGQITSATQGSVSMSMQPLNSSNEFAGSYMQSTYGSDYWEATEKYRTGFYVSAPRKRRRYC